MPRVCLLILLVVLLPIRSFAFESMGFSVAQPTHSMEMMADSDASHCEMMQSSSKQDPQSEQHDKPTCNACSLCMAFAFASPSIAMNFKQLSYQFVQQEPLFVYGALLALPIKPPIL
ncbi:hypothetical protein [Polynucleobacter sp. UK-Gri1-W3]|uniref:hypothetical protein n=1 Tax=Polynucleobacter sp. UK-Gri1-W3 TaxID=1819737 RepID=UPI001C0D0D4E|nr:hypothetical protein [Polynucleobacter sp. UK-Gri1-W3]MBU3539076.1 hypothetical protein [Polynucleobacter sp. UK-Gri1-W3]QWD31586.1 hypothetical protein G6681_07640 [Polynucleobacter paneuropaeus]